MASRFDSKLVFHYWNRELPRNKAIHFCKEQPQDFLFLLPGQISNVHISLNICPKEFQRKKWKINGQSKHLFFLKNIKYVNMRKFLNHNWILWGFQMEWLQSKPCLLQNHKFEKHINMVANLKCYVVIKLKVRKTITTWKKSVLKH